MKKNIITTLLICFALIGCSAKSTQPKVQESKQNTEQKTACYAKVEFETNPSNNNTSFDIAAMDLIEKKLIDTKSDPENIFKKCNTVYIEANSNEFMVYDTVSNVAYFGFINLDMLDYKSVFKDIDIVDNVMRDAEFYTTTYFFVDRENVLNMLEKPR